MTSDKTKIRNAATVIVVRNKHDNPSVLMGQRGVNAAFMPSKFVFPGGAVDDQDLSIDITKSINEVCKKRLLKENANGPWNALVAAAIRELFEETGQIIGKPTAANSSSMRRGRGTEVRLRSVSYTHLTLPTKA